MSRARATWVVIASLVSLIGFETTARTEEAHKRVSVSVNTPFLLIPVYLLTAELALHRRWSISLHGGGGVWEAYGTSSTIFELGAQGTYYLFGNVDRGVQVGIDGRYVGFEGEGQLAGLGDGVAVGPFVGYKRVFGPGVTLGAQVGGQVVLSGESEDPVVMTLALSVGWSFWSSGEPEAAITAAPAGTDALLDPLDHHRGFLIGWSLGVGAITTEGCSSCEMDPSISVDASMGWFVHRRVAILYDVAASVGLLQDGFGSAGFALQSAAVEYWPHEDFSLKLGIGVASLITATLLDVPTEQLGGGGTFAAAYEFHHDGRFSMNAQLRVTHGSFDKEGGGSFGMNSFVGTIGWDWY